MCVKKVCVCVCVRVKERGSEKDIQRERGKFKSWDSSLSVLILSLCILGLNNFPKVITVLRKKRDPFSFLFF